jgi:hypothetical protein
LLRVSGILAIGRWNESAVEFVVEWGFVGEMTGSGVVVKLGFG